MLVEHDAFLFLQELFNVMDGVSNFWKNTMRMGSLTLDNFIDLTGAQE